MPPNGLTFVYFVSCCSKAIRFEQQETKYTKDENRADSRQAFCLEPLALESDHRQNLAADP